MLAKAVAHQQHVQPRCALRAGLTSVLCCCLLLLLLLLLAGKTMLAKAVAHHTTAAFIRVVGSEFVQKYLGEVSGNSAASLSSLNDLRLVVHGVGCECRNYSNKERAAEAPCSRLSAPLSAPLSYTGQIRRFAACRVSARCTTSVQL
jgi:hypothetical protein